MSARSIAREYVSERLRTLYREQPRFDTGERDERRARSELRPQGDVGVVTYTRSPRAADTAGGVTESCKEDTMPSKIPAGSRVRSTLGGFWVGTVLRESENSACPLRVAWDNGVVENCTVGELDVLSVPVGAPVDPGVLEDALDIARDIEAQITAGFDRALGESRN